MAITIGSNSNLFALTKNKHYYRQTFRNSDAFAEIQRKRLPPILIYVKYFLKLIDLYLHKLYTVHNIQLQQGTLVSIILPQ